MSGVKIRKGDEVLVRTGRDAGKTGEVVAVFPRENRAVVRGVSMIKRHQKPTQAEVEGGIIEKESKIHLSNLAVADPKTGEATRIGFKTLEDGRKVRFSKKSGEVIDQ